MVSQKLVGLERIYFGGENKVRTRNRAEIEAIQICACALPRYIMDTPVKWPF